MKGRSTKKQRAELLSARLHKKHPAAERLYSQAIARTNEKLRDKTLRAHGDEACKTYDELLDAVIQEANGRRFGNQKKVFKEATKQWKQSQSQMRKVADLARQLAKLLTKDLPWSFAKNDQQPGVTYESPDHEELAALLGEHYENLDGSPVVVKAHPKTRRVRNPHVDVAAMVMSAIDASRFRLDLAPNDVHTPRNKLIARFLEDLAKQCDKRRVAGTWDPALAQELGPVAFAGAGLKHRPLIAIPRGIETLSTLAAAQFLAFFSCYHHNGFRHVDRDWSQPPTGKLVHGDLAQTWVEVSLGLNDEDAAKSVRSARGFWASARIPHQKQDNNPPEK